MIDISSFYDGKEEINIVDSNDPNAFYYPDEKFIPITQDVIPGIYDWYLISNYGKVYHKYAGRMISYSIYYSNGNINKPYYSVGLCTDHGLISVRVHRLVMACFYPQFGPINQKLDINHKNGKTNDNYISYNDPNRGNLEWITHSQNLIHAYQNGLHHIGEDNVHSKISNEVAMKAIKLLAENKYTSKEICEIIGNGLTTHIVDDIRKKQCWNHLSNGYNFNQRINRLFNEDDIKNICNYFQNNPKSEDININDYCRFVLFNLGYDNSDRYVDTVRKIYTRKYYTKISSQYIF